MPNDSLKKLFEERFGRFDIAGRQAFTHDHVLSFLTEQVALARSEIANELKQITEEKDMSSDWVKAELESYIVLLSPAPIIPEGEKLV